MVKKTFLVISSITLAATLGLSGCGGAGNGNGTIFGLLFRSIGNNTSSLHRIPAEGGAVANIGVANTLWGSMAQDGTVFTSVAGNIVRIKNGVPVQITNSVSNGSPCVSPDGAKVVFISQRNNLLDVYSINADGTNETRLTDGADNAEAAISKNKSKVVFVSNRDGNNEIYVMNIDGSGQSRLTNNAALDMSPAFSPDGQQVVFASNRVGGVLQIFRMNIDGTNVVQLTTGSNDKAYASFNVTGTAIFYAATTPGNTVGLFRCDPDGSNVTAITTGIADCDKTTTWVY